jgi:hypothetical protein
MIIAGNVHTDQTDIKLYINYKEQKIHNGKFMVSLPLEEGANDFEIIITNAAGSTIAEEKRMIFCGFLPPALSIEDIPDVTPQTSITLTGTARDVNQHKSILTLKINGETIDINPANDGFSCTYPLEIGSNHFDILVYDGGLRKTVVRKVIEHHPKAPEIVFSGIGPVITSRKVELTAQLSNYDPMKITVRIHNKAVSVTDNILTYHTSIRTDKGEIPFGIDWGGRQILSFTRQVVFLPSPPTVTIDEEFKALHTTQCRISGTISDENDVDPRIFVNNKEINQRAGAWSTTLTLTEGVNEIIFEGRNQTGLKKILRKKIMLPKGGWDLT